MTWSLLFLFPFVFSHFPSDCSGDAVQLLFSLQRHSSRKQQQQQRTHTNSHRRPLNMCFSRNGSPEKVHSPKFSSPCVGFPVRPVLRQTSLFCVVLDRSKIISIILMPCGTSQMLQINMLEPGRFRKCSNLFWHRFFFNTATGGTCSVQWCKPLFDFWIVIASRAHYIRCSVSFDWSSSPLTIANTSR